MLIKDKSQVIVSTGGAGWQDPAPNEAGIMTAGTFAVSRQIWSHPEFAPCAFSEREAFLWLVSEASWKERTSRSGRVVVDLQRGQLCASVRFMAEAWQWSKSRVDRFLKRLENRDMLVTETGTGQLVITLCNYDEYQGQRDTSGTRAGQSAGHERDASGTNYNKDEIREKKEIGKPISRGSSEKEILGELEKWASRTAAESFIAYRKRMKGKALTVLAAKRIATTLGEIFNARGDPDDALGMAEEKGWMSVQADWYFKAKKGASQNGQQNAAFGTAINAIADGLSTGTIRLDNSRSDPFAPR